MKLALYHLLRWLVAHGELVFAGAIFAVISAIISAIGAALGAVGTSLAAAVTWIVSTALPIIFAAIKYIGSLIGRGFSYFYKGVKYFVNDILKTHLVDLWKHVVKITNAVNQWVHDHLGWLFKLRSYFDKWFRRVVVPVLNVLHRIRGVLQIFRIFHLKFAERLDALLAKVEAKIIKNTLLVRKVINELITTLDLLIDPSLILRRNVLAGTLLSWLGAVKRVVAFGSNRALTDQEAQHQKEDRELLKKNTVVVSGGATPVYHPALQRILTSLDKEAKNYT